MAIVYTHFFDSSESHLTINSTVVLQRTAQCWFLSSSVAPPMSTLLVFSRKKGLRSRDDKRSTALGKSVAELDSILSRNVNPEPTFAGDSDENESRTTPTSASSSSFQRQKAGHCQGIEHYQGIPFRAFCSAPTTPPHDGEGYDTKSLGSNTILSGDVTVLSDHLIANIKHVQESQNSLSTEAMSSRTSRRSKSRGSSERSRRGDSLERDISRTILQRTLISHDVVPESPFKSTQEILYDLTEKLSSMLGNEIVNVDASSTAGESENRAIHGDRSLLDVDEEWKAHSGLLGDHCQGEKMEVDNAILSASSSCYSIELPFISSDETPWSYRSGSLLACEMNDTESFLVRVESSESLSVKASDSSEAKQIYSDGIMDFSKENFPDEPKCNLVTSLASTTFTLVAPLMKGHPRSSQPQQSNGSFHSAYQSKVLQRQKVPSVPDKGPNATEQSTERVFKTSDLVDEGWAPFGGDSAFGDSYSAGRHDFSKTSALPTDAVAPESPSSILIFSTHDDLKLAPLPDNGFSHGTAFPAIIASDSGLEEVSRRFKI